MSATSTPRRRRSLLAIALILLATVAGVVVWANQPEQWTRRTKLGDCGDPGGLIFSPDGRWLACTHIGGVDVLDATGRHPPLKLPGSEEYPNALGFTPDGHTWFASDGNGKGLARWEIPSGRGPTLCDFIVPRWAARRPPEGGPLRLVVTWEYSDGRPDPPPVEALQAVKAACEQNNNGVWAELAPFPQLAFVAPGGAYFVTCGPISDLGAESIEIRGASGKVLAASFGEPWTFSPDGKSLVYGPGGGNLRLFDLESARERPLPEYLGFECAFSPDGKLLAYKQAIRRARPGWVGHVPDAIRFSRLFRRLGVDRGQYVEGRVIILDVPTARPIARLDGASSSGDALGLVFSPDGSRLAFHDEAGAVWLYDVPSRWRPARDATR